MLLIIKKENNKKVFPQANDIHKLIKYVDKSTFNYHEDKLKRVNLNYVQRQDDYYKNAAKYKFNEWKWPYKLSISYF